MAQTKTAAKYTITRRGFEILKAEVPKDVEALVRRELTVAPVSLNDPFPKKFKVYLESSTRYVVPLHWARAKGLVADADARGAGADIDVSFKGQLREDLRQPEAVAAVQRSWDQCGGAMLCTVCGGGKTTMALYLAAQLRKKTLVVVHTAVLKDQWKERIAHFVPDARVTEVQGPRCDTSGDFVVAMIQTLVSRTYPPATFADIGLVISDECFPYRQRIATETGTQTIGSIYKAWKAGECVKVHSFNEDTQKFEVREVTHAWQKEADELVEVTHCSGQLKCTPSHRILTMDGWRAAGTLREGDLVVARQAHGEPGAVRVSAVRRFVPADKRVYDLEVEGTHTFVCASITGGGPVVHNCHHVAAPTLSQAMFGLCAPRTLGMSATPHRKDGLARVVEWMLGPVAFLAKRTGQVTTEVRAVRYTCPEFEQPMPTNRRGDVCFVSTITRLAENAERTALVAGLVAALAKQEGRHVLVLSHRRQHCKDLSAAIAGLGVESGTYLGGDKEPPATRVIVATYALTSEGFDMPRLNALVLATPASDVEQSCGRVMRGSPCFGVQQTGAAASAVIVDVVDQWGLCHAQHAKRRTLYRQSGFVVRDGGTLGTGPTAAVAATPQQPSAPTPEFAFLND